MLLDHIPPLRQKNLPPRKTLYKKGTLDIDIVEATPIVWKGRLIRFEWIRDTQFGRGYYDNIEDCCYFRFTDMETEQVTPAFAHHYRFGSAHVEDDTVYVYGTQGSAGGQKMAVFYSKDLIHWESREILCFSDRLTVFNNSVCKGRNEYIMSIELGGDREVVGHQFTIFFARSRDLLNWEMMDMSEHVYTRDRYSACPVIRYCADDDRYYMIYLEALPCHRYLPYIVRTADFVRFELGHRNPIMCFDDVDKLVQRPEKFTGEQLAYIKNAINCNNSDIDLCEFEGKTVIIYSWGNQLGKEFLAEAAYDGSVNEFLHSFFAD